VRPALAGLLSPTYRHCQRRAGVRAAAVFLCGWVPSCVPDRVNEQLHRATKIMQRPSSYLALFGAPFNLC
jgi:hypothetical protein